MKVITFNYLDWKKLLIILLLIIHVFTLTFSPLPWFDEVFFADISKNFSEGKGLKLLIAPEISIMGQEVLVYGPVYFFLQAIPIYFFGLEKFIFRLVCFLGGVLSIFFLGEIFRFFSKNMKTSWVWILVLCDPMFFSSSHGGRMDLWALAFLLAAISFYLSWIKEEKAIFLVISSLFMALSVLTTPRILAPGLGLAILVSIFSLKSMKNFKINIVFWLVPFMFIISAWVFFAFGGIAKLLIYYGAETSSYVGGRFNFPKQIIPLLIAGFISIVILIVKKKLPTEVILFGVFGVLSYLILVKDSGPYSILLVFFIYLFVLLSGHLRYSPVFIIVIFNGVFFISKILFLTFSYEQRKSDVIFQKLIELPPESTIIADDIYYYDIISSGHKFLFKDHLVSMEKKLVFYKKNDFDFILVRNKSYPDNNFNFLKSHINLQEVESFQIPINSTSNYLQSLIPITIHNNIDGTLYKAIE